MAAWYLLAAAEFFFIAGDTTYTVVRVVFHEANPFPSLADVIYLITYPCFAAGLFLFIRARSAGRDRAALIDAVIITTGLALLSWVYLVIPDFQTVGLSGLEQFISVAYPLGDVLVLAMLVRLIGGCGLRIRSMRLLVLSTVWLVGRRRALRPHPTQRRLAGERPGRHRLGVVLPVLGLRRIASVDARTQRHPAPAQPANGRVAGGVACSGQSLRSGNIVDRVDHPHNRPRNHGCDLLRSALPARHRPVVGHSRGTQAVHPARAHSAGLD
jgi:hypothetical protein